MSKDKKFPIFGGLFDNESLNVSSEFRKAIVEAIRKSKYSREQIVQLIQILTGQSISKQMLDQTTSSKTEYRFPAEILHALCVITGSLEPLRVLARAIGCEVITPRERKELELMRLVNQKERIEKEIDRIKKELKEE